MRGGREGVRRGVDGGEGEGEEGEGREKEEEGEGWGGEEGRGEEWRGGGGEEGREVGGEGGRGGREEGKRRDGKKCNTEMGIPPIALKRVPVDTCVLLLIDTLHVCNYIPGSSHYDSNKHSDKKR